MAKTPVIIGFTTVLSNTTTQDIVLPHNMLDLPLVISGISVADLTNTMTSITLGFMNSNVVNLLATVLSLAAGVYYAIYPNILIDADNLVLARTAGGTAGDIIKVTLFGYVLDQAEQISL